MSFTLDLIVIDVPNEKGNDWKFIENLREDYYKDESDTHEKLTRLHKVLTEKYPCLCSFDEDNPDMDESPWADGPMINNFASKMGMIAIRFSEVEEVFPFVLEKALELGIIVADGQSEKIYRPGTNNEITKKPRWKFW